MERHALGSTDEDAEVGPLQRPDVSFVADTTSKEKIRNAVHFQEAQVFWFVWPDGDDDLDPSGEIASAEKLRNAFFFSAC